MVSSVSTHLERPLFPDFTPPKTVLFDQKIFNSRGDLANYVSLIGGGEIGHLAKRIKSCGDRLESFLHLWRCSCHVERVAEGVLKIATTENRPAPCVRNSSLFPIKLKRECEENMPLQDISCISRGETIEIVLPMGGCCSGMSHWFVMQYLKTRHLFSYSRDHMQWLGSLFKGGAHTGAVALQLFNLGNGKELGLEIGRRGANEQVLIPFEALKLDERASFTKMIEEFPQGAYRIETLVENRGHVCVYIKEGGAGYFFDPNRGVFESIGISQGEALCDWILAAVSFLQKGLDEDECTMRKWVVDMEITTSLLHSSPYTCKLKKEYEDQLQRESQQFNKALSNYLNSHKEKKGDFLEIKRVLRNNGLANKARAIFNHLTRSWYKVTFIPVVLREDPQVW